MDKDMAFQLALRMCEQGGVRYQVMDGPDGDKIIGTPVGSAAVYISVTGEGKMLSYTFFAVFVENIPADVNELELLRWVNDRNFRGRFGRIFLVKRYDSENFNLILQEEILASNVQQEEFINSLHAAWAHADGHDDEAVRLFGGETAHQVMFGDN